MWTCEQAILLWKINPDVFKPPTAIDIQCWYGESNFSFKTNAILYKPLAYLTNSKSEFIESYAIPLLSNELYIYKNIYICTCTYIKDVDLYSSQESCLLWSSVIKYFCLLLHLFSLILDIYSLLTLNDGLKFSPSAFISRGSVTILRKEVEMFKNLTQVHLQRTSRRCNLYSLSFQMLNRICSFWPKGQNIVLH